MKKVVRLNENELKTLIKNSVNKVINESSLGNESVKDEFRYQCLRAMNDKHRYPDVDALWGHFFGGVEPEVWVNAGKPSWDDFKKAYILFSRIGLWEEMWGDNYNNYR